MTETEIDELAEEAGVLAPLDAALTKAEEEKELARQPAWLWNGFEPIALNPLITGRLLVKEEPRKKVTDGGIILPETVDTRFKFYSILAVSKNLTSLGADCPFKVGQIVYMGSYAGQEIELHQQLVRIVSIHDVTGRWYSHQG